MAHWLIEVIRAPAVELLQLVATGVALELSRRAGARAVRVERRLPDGRKRSKSSSSKPRATRSPGPSPQQPPLASPPVEPASNAG